MPGADGQHEILVQLVHELDVLGLDQVHAFGQNASWWERHIFLEAVPSSTPGLKSVSEDAPALMVAAHGRGLGRNSIGTDLSGTWRPRPWATGRFSSVVRSRLAPLDQVTRMGICRSLKGKLSRHLRQISERRDADRLTDALHADTQLRRDIQARCTTISGRGKSPLIRASRTSGSARIAPGLDGPFRSTSANHRRSNTN